MNDTPKKPTFDDDPQLDRTLRGIGRFNPRRGFEDRVVSRVRVPLPRWLRRRRDWLRATLSGVTGWTILATFSAATAAAWGSMLAAGLRERDAIVGGVSFSLDWAIRAAGREVLALVTEPAAAWAVAVRQSIAGAGVSVRALLLGYGIVALVSALALWRLMAEPARAKGAINVVR